MYRYAHQVHQVHTCTHARYVAPPPPPPPPLPRRLTVHTCIQREFAFVLCTGRWSNGMGRIDERMNRMMFSLSVFSPIPCIPFFVFVLLLFSTHTASLLLFLFYFSFQHTYLHFYAFSHSASSSTEHTKFTRLQQVLWNKHLWWDTLLTVGHRSRNVEMNFLIS